MNIEEKQKLLQLLYPNDEIRDFLINDLYQELINIIPKSLCISSKNLVNSTREKNLQKVKMYINDFFKDNESYIQTINDLFSVKYNEMIEDVIIGFCFYLSQTKNNDIHIFKDKRSICFSEVSIIDIL